MKKKEEKRNKRNQPVNFTFGGEAYTDINRLKSLFKNILSRATNNVALPKKEQDLVRHSINIDCGVVAASRKGCIEG